MGMVEEVTVSGEPGYWFSGEPYFFTYTTPTASARSRPAWPATPSTATRRDLHPPGGRHPEGGGPHRRVDALSARAPGSLGCHRSRIPTGQPTQPPPVITYWCCVTPWPGAAFLRGRPATLHVRAACMWMMVSATWGARWPAAKASRVLRRHGRAAPRPAPARHGDLHEAEEVVQEAFARASVRWTRLRDYDVPEAWVRRVALNLAADRSRQLRRQGAGAAAPGPAAAVLAAPAEAVALLEALRTLPMRQRQVIVLHHLVDLPIEEVAATLGTRPGTVKPARPWPPRPGQPAQRRRGGAQLTMIHLRDHLQELAEAAASRRAYCRAYGCHPPRPPTTPPPRRRHRRAAGCESWPLVPLAPRTWAQAAGTWRRPRQLPGRASRPSWPPIPLTAARRRRSCGC